MTDRTVLIGAEEVRSAGHAMERAADEMTRAASAITSALQAQQEWMTEWLDRFDTLLKESHATHHHAS